MDLGGRTTSVTCANSGIYSTLPSGAEPLLTIGVRSIRIPPTMTDFLKCPVSIRIDAQATS